jgi:hypothetical protein
LNIICQHAFNDGIFPNVWKRAVVLPLYKGRGERGVVSSFRPISICPCLGKVMEKVVHRQLTSYLNDNNLLHHAQHGFTCGRSTVTNMLHFDAAITDAASSNHAYDVIAVDFKKAFDKAPHECVLDALKCMGVSGKAHHWFASFLQGRTQQVRVGCSLSYEYYIHGVKISSVDGFPDLGVHRSACGTYAGHCEALAAKASRVAGAVRKAFHSRSRALLWPAYQYYVLPLLMYMSPAWSPRLKRDVDRLERVQRRYTKMITELHGLPYLVRLRELQALTLSNMRTFADMVFVFKCLHGLVNFPATDIGFDLVTSITRGSGCRLKQRHINSATKNLFAVRAVTTWNSLPNNIITCKSIGQFKCMLRKHLISLQC